MIKHEATRPLVFSPNYYQTRQNLLDIESLKVDDLDIHAYRYVMKPTLPIRRDSPKKGNYLDSGGAAGWHGWRGDCAGA